MTQTLFAETWEEKAKRLALVVVAMTPSDESPTAKERLAYRQAKYELQCHLEKVAGA